MSKGIISFLLIILFVTQSSWAQNVFTGHVGANYSNVSSKNSINPDGILGANGGFAYKFYLDDLGWSLMPGFEFSQEGFKDQRLNYLNVPLSVGFDFTSTFSLSTGFQYSQLLSGSNEAKEIVYNSNFAFLVTFEFFPTEKFVTGLKFANGIKNIIKNPDLIIVKTASTYSIQFYIGITLYRGSK
jgi:hypothetical protein